MFDLHVEKKENGIYEVGYKTKDMQEAFKICDILEALDEEKLQATYEVIEEKAEDIEDTSILDDSEYDINTNRYINKSNNYSFCPLKPFLNTSWKLVSNVYLKSFYNSANLEQGYKDAILKEWNERGLDKNDLLNSKDANVNNDKSKIVNSEEAEKIRKAEIDKQIELIKNGRDIFSLSDDELKKIAEIDYDTTASAILKAREKEKQELKEDENGIINFGTEENKDRRKEKSDDDPLSQNAGGWDDDGFVFEDEEDGFIFS